MKIKVKHLYKWLSKQYPKIKGLEFKDQDGKYKVIGIEYYNNPNGILLKERLGETGNKPHKANRYGITLLEPNKDLTVKEVTHQHYYKSNETQVGQNKLTTWETATQPYKGLKTNDTIEITNKFYHDSHTIKRYKVIRC